MFVHILFLLLQMYYILINVASLSDVFSYTLVAHSVENATKPTVFASRLSHHGAGGSNIRRYSTGVRPVACCMRRWKVRTLVKPAS